MAVLPAVTAVQLHQSAMHTRREFNDFLHDRGEQMVLPAFTAILLHHINMDTWTDCNIFDRG